jgi:hypothetical protein
MPKFFDVIFDKFLDTYIKEKKAIENDRDAMIELYLYYSHFMDYEISRNKREKDKYTKLKTLGLKFIKSNGKIILNKLKNKV